jgi:CDP-diacylglycerol--serine O-phosphatidyltransferase
LPNIVTLLALCAGVTAIRLGIEGRFELAIGAVIIAVVLDAVDGRLARFLKGTTKFGAELDSLADFVNFGVVPAVLIYFWSLQALRNLGWIVALGLAICCALRLARFNVAIEDPDKPAWMSGYFTGVPAPAGAGLALAPFYLGFLGLIPDPRAAAPGHPRLYRARRGRHGVAHPDLFRQDDRPAGEPRDGAADPRGHRARRGAADRLYLADAGADGARLHRLDPLRHPAVPAPERRMGSALGQDAGTGRGAGELGAV